MRRALQWIGVCTVLAFVTVVASCDEKPTEPEEQTTTATPEAAVETPAPSMDVVPLGVDVWGDCLNEDPDAAPDGTRFNNATCSANDVEIKVLQALAVDYDGVGVGDDPVPITPGESVTCVEGSTFEVQLRAFFGFNRQTTYDIGYYLAEDGGDAQIGDCFHGFLEPIASGAGTPTAGPPFNGPYRDAEQGTDPNDVCGDGSENDETTVLGIAGIGAVKDVPEWITVMCEDDDADGAVEIGTCTSWDINASDGSTNKPTCEGVDDAYPGTTAKCNCEPAALPINLVRQATVEVKKALSPTDDAGTFDLALYDYDDNAVESATAVGNGGTTGQHTFMWNSDDEPEQNQASAQETGANLGSLDETTTPSAFDFYTTTYSCVESNNGNGPVNGSGTGPVNLTLETGDAWVCTFTNTRIAPPDITVDKTVVEKFDRDWDWTILKSADQGGEPPTGGTDVVIMSLGQTVDANYSVKITGNYTDSNFRVSGVITVSAPANTAPYSGSVTVTDNVAGNDATVSNCSSTTLTPGNSITCDYSYTFPGTPTGSETNTAKAVVNWNTGDTETDYSAAKSISFDYPADVDTESDDKVQVSDTNTQFGGPFTWDANADGSSADGQMKTWTYQISLSCPDYGADFQVPNTASFTTSPSDNATPDTGSDDWLINVVCPSPPDVCTLTQGYWKNHCLNSPDRDNAGCNARWPDDNWLNVGPLGEDESFFLSGDTWQEVFTTAPKGNVYYNLAWQWMAANLNSMNGAAIPGAVQSAYDAGQAILSSCTPQNLKPVKGNKTESCSGSGYTASEIHGFSETLTMFNEGYYSSHCTEDASSGL